MSLSAATLKRRSRTGRNSSMSSAAIPSSSTKSNSKMTARAPLKDLQEVQGHVNNVCASVTKVLEDSEVNPFGTRSKLVSF